MSRARDRLSSLAARVRARPLRWALALAALLSLPSLGVGWFADDYLFRLRLERAPFSWRTALDLYRFTPAPSQAAAVIARGELPWFYDARAQSAFLRPLSSLSFTLDWLLCSRHLALAHLHSIAWLLALVAAAWLVLRRALPGAVGVLALCLFAVDDTHAQAIGWLSSRHLTLAAGPALVGLWAHLRWREDGWRPGLPLSLGAFALGLGGSEVALQVLIYVGAYELLGARRRRLAALAPAALVGVAYLAAYRALGYGAHGGDIYLDPLGAPGRFLVEAAARAPVLVGELFGGLPSDWSQLVPKLVPLFAAIGVGVLGVVAWLVRRVWPSLPEAEARAVRWLGAAALLSIVPGLGAPIGSRPLLVPSLGGAAVVATLIVRLPALATRAARLGARWLIAVHALAPPLVLVGNLVLLQVTARSLESMAQASRAAAGDATQVVALDMPEPLSAIYQYAMVQLDPRGPLDAWWLLSMAPLDHVLTRLDDHAFLLEVEGGALFESGQERLFRPSRAPLAPGAQVRLPGLTIEVLSPRALRVTLARRLDDPSLCLLSWRAGWPARLALPPVGARVRLARADAWPPRP